MPEVALVTAAAGDRSLRELAETLRYELEHQDVVCSLHDGPLPEPSPQRVHVLIDPWSYAEVQGPDALPQAAILRRTVLVCTEPLPEPAGDERLSLLEGAGAVFVLDQREVVTLARHGIRARLLRPGYSAWLDRFDPAAPRPIDVVFGQAGTARQRGYVDTAARALPGFERRSEGEAPGDRRSLLAQAKLIIDVHAGEDPRLDWRRAVDAIHAGAVVVSEHSSGVAPLVPGEHLLVAAPDALPYVARAVLEDEPRLAELRTAAHRRLHDWLPYALPVAILRAALVELVGEPLPDARATPPGVSPDHGG